MSWIVDNATTLYILFALLGVAMMLIWRSNRQNKYLASAGGAVVLIALIWLLKQFHASDAMQLENNVHAMFQAVTDGRIDDLFKHISKDFHSAKARKHTRMWAWTRSARWCQTGRTLS